MKQKLAIFDCDGVIYRGGRRLPHALETFRVLRKERVPCRFITNNSTQTRKEYLDKLLGMGIEAELGEIHSSAHASRLYLDGAARPGARVLVVGEKGLREEISASFEVVPHTAWSGAQYVVVGMDREFTYEKLKSAFLALRAGARLIATNRDPTFPMEGGAILPGGGSIVAAIEAAAGREGFLIGKPAPFMLERALEETGADPGASLLIGDRASTDILAGKRAGVRTLLVLTGVTSAGEARALPAALRPDFVSPDLRGALAAFSIGGADRAVKWKDFVKHAA